MTDSKRVKINALHIQAESINPERNEQTAENSTSNNDQKILSSLYARQNEELLRYLRKLLGSGPPPPEDVAQSAFSQLAARGNLGEIKNLPGFLWRAAQNIISSEFRKKSRQGKSRRRHR